MPAIQLPLTPKSAPPVAAPKGTYAFVSLGCPKNLVDSERMLGRLAQDGYTLVPNAEGADDTALDEEGHAQEGSERGALDVRP